MTKDAMRSQGAPIVPSSAANQTILFRGDGTYATGAVEGRLEMQHQDTYTQAEVSAQAEGHWSTSGGVLNLCADMQAFAGRANVTTPEGRRTIVAPAMPAADSSERYTCNGARLDTERDIRGAPPMLFHYTRTGGD